MHTSFLLKDLAVIMTTAAVVMYACHRLRQPAIIGYLLAGLFVGPHTPPFSFVSDVESIRSVSELGLVFLMFSLGLEFNLPRLRRAGLAAAVTAAVVVGGMLLTGLAAGRLLGWPLAGSLLLGAVLSISGSTIIAKVFFDLRVTREPFARAVFGLMICDDVAAMVMLSVVSGLGAQSGSLAAVTAITFVRIIFFILLFLTLGLLLVPRVLAAVARLESRELMGISALGLCFAGAYMAARFDFSIALGTFLMGALVAASPQADEIGEWAAPLRDMFSALFFVSAGMLVDPAGVVRNWLPVLLILLLAVAGRSFWGITASLAAGYDLRMAVRVGLSSAQIGEFSFILAAAGISAGLASDWLYGITVAIAMITTFLFPYIMRNMAAIEGVLLRLAPAGFVRLCERYREMVWKPSPEPRLDRPSIISKYALRLVIYVTVATGVFYGGGTLAELLSVLYPAGGAAVPAAVWLAAAVPALPVFMAIARYISHLALLFVTVAATRFSPKLAGRLNIRGTYNLVNVCCMAALGFVFLLFISYWVTAGLAFYMVTGLFLLGFTARAALLSAMDFAERMLDQIIGLATSEPVHQLAAGADGSLRGLSTTRWLVGAGSTFAGRTLRELGLHAATGARVIAIYREGGNMLNPPAATPLASGDILILLGSAEQCAAADAYLHSLNLP